MPYSLKECPQAVLEGRRNGGVVQTSSVQEVVGLECTQGIGHSQGLRPFSRLHRGELGLKLALHLPAELPQVLVQGLGKHGIEWRPNPGDPGCSANPGEEPHALRNDGIDPRVQRPFTNSRQFDELPHTLQVPCKRRLVQVIAIGEVAKERPPRHPRALCDLFRAGPQVPLCIEIEQRIDDRQPVPLTPCPPPVDLPRLLRSATRRVHTAF